MKQRSLETKMKCDTLPCHDRDSLEKSRTSKPCMIEAKKRKDFFDLLMEEDLKRNKRKCRNYNRQYSSQENGLRNIVTMMI